MPAYRFRVTLAADPTALWRDIVVGADQLLTEFQATLNEADQSVLVSDVTMVAKATFSCTCSISTVGCSPGCAPGTIIT